MSAGKYNILWVAKMGMFRQENSTNRYELLNHLDKYENIRVVNDLKQRDLKRKIAEFTRQGWKPDAVIYYCVSYAEKWRDIAIKNFIGIKCRKLLFFEDFHYHKLVIEMYKKYEFDGLLHPLKHRILDGIYRQLGLKVYNYGFFINGVNFKDWGVKKDIDILMYGYIHPTMYPLRHKIKQVLDWIIKNTQYKIKIINHPGYQDKAILLDLPREATLSKLIARSRFAIATGSIRKITVKKYMEIPMSGTIVIGDIPPDYDGVLRGNVVELMQEMSLNDIARIILDACAGKYNHLNGKSELQEYMLKNHSFDASYHKLNEIIAKVLES